MKKFRPLAVIFAALLSANASAGVGKISSPDVTKGEFEVEYSATRYGDESGSALNNKQAHTYELEYGFTDRFMLGLEVGQTRESPQGSKIEGYGVEAQYELTRQGDWWLNSAIKAEYLHAAHDADPDELELKMLASYSAGANKLTGNLSFESELGNSRDHGIALESAVQAKHTLNEHFAPGIEWHAEYGNLSDLGNSDDVKHYVGPVLTGTLFDFGSSELEYTAGYYWGLTDVSANNAARIQLGYSIAF